MSFKILSSDELPGEEWSLLTGDSFLSSPAFASLWEIFDGRAVFLVEEENGALKAGMAGVVFGRKYIRRFKSMPDGLYGGIFWAGGISDEDKNYFLISCKNFFKEEKFIRADIYNPPFLFQSEAFVPRMASTHILRLQGDSYEIPNRRMKKYIRHAQKTDIKIAPLDDEKYLDGFYRLVLLTARRHKTKPRYSKKFFQRLYRISREDSRVIWPMVVYENSIVASHIYFVERSQILDWQSCCDQDNRLRPNYLLYDYIIKLAISRGIKELNLGGTPPEADSLMEFKERWGGMKIAYPYYTYLSNIGKLIYRGHRA